MGLIFYLSSFLHPFNLTGFTKTYSHCPPRWSAQQTPLLPASAAFLYLRCFLSLHFPPCSRHRHIATAPFPFRNSFDHAYHSPAAPTQFAGPNLVPNRADLSIPGGGSRNRGRSSSANNLISRSFCLRGARRNLCRNSHVMQCSSLPILEIQDSDSGFI